MDDIGAYLQMFESTAEAGSWLPAQWSTYLRRSLSGQGLIAVTSLTAAEQRDYDRVEETLLATYRISSETYPRRVFDLSFDSNNPDTWFRSFKQSYTQWIEASHKN